MLKFSKTNASKTLAWVVFVSLGTFVFCFSGAIKSLIRLNLKVWLSGQRLEILLRFEGVFYFFGFVALFKLIQWVGLLPERTWLISEGYCQKFLRLPLQWILSIIIALWFLLWAPHYLYWPWWMDLEHFSVSAHAWDQGIKPYRDLIDFNFPGPIYIMWMIGKLFGWNHPMAANFLDIMVCIVLFCLTIRWSKRVFDSSTAGLIGCILMARYYMSLDASRVMQREWYVIALGIGMLMITQMTTHRYKYLFSGFVLAVALVIRPYAILLLPAVIVSVVIEYWGQRLKTEIALKQIVLSGLVSSLILWSPLVFHGIADDFFRETFRELMYGNYDPQGREAFHWTVYNQIATKVIFSALCTVVLTLYLLRNDPCKLGLVLPWVVMFVSMVFYKPLCPVMHAYTEIPLEMVAGLMLGIFWGVFENFQGVSSRFKVSLIGFWTWFFLPAFPDMLSVSSSREALVSMVSSTGLEKSPPGWAGHLKDRNKIPKVYFWQDYQSALEFIREETSSEVRVVNFIRKQPFPTFNGPTGRLSLWPCAEGIQWLRWVHPELELEYANSLQSQVPSIVIWNDREEMSNVAIKYPLIDRLIRREYEPLARFGQIDIWKRRGIQIKPDR